MKKRRQRCALHKATGRSWDKYVFGFIDYKGTEIWRCIQCKERDEKWLAEYEKQQETKRKKLSNHWREWYRKQAELKQKEKDELWDSFIIKQLLSGEKNKYSFYGKIPKELLQLKRASIKLERLIKEKRKIKNQPTREKQDDIVLDRALINCKKHGDLYFPDVIKSGKNKRTGQQLYKCKKCMSDIHKLNYQKNKEKILERFANYRKNNPERRAEIKSKSWKNRNVKNNKHETIERDSTKGD